MRKWRLLLLPFAWVYGTITWIRNKFFDWGIFKTKIISGKSIVVGNLSVGGTGKTPHVDYLIQHFLKLEVQLSTLSRGYGRKTKGLIHANEQSIADEIGDEPLLFKRKHGDRIEVIVAEKRVEGVEFIQSNLPKNELILLDDAFQHRAVTAGFNVLLTPFNDLYTNDHVLPAGNLREWRSGKKRADIIIVTKTPESATLEQKRRIKEELKFDTKKIFFSTIIYGKLKAISNTSPEKIEHVLIVTGIANPTPLLNEWEKRAKVEHLSFGDHHNFTQKDINDIHEKFDTFANRNKVIITTEKDYVRLLAFPEVQEDRYQWHYQPITIELDDNKTFNKLLNGYFSEI